MKFLLQSCLSLLAALSDTEIENGYLFPLLDISQRMHRMALNVFVPILLRVVIAGMVYAACMDKDSCFDPSTPIGRPLVRIIPMYCSEVVLPL